MANYKISQNAEADLIRIYQYGVINFGIRQADMYYDKLEEHFEQIAQNPYLYQPTDYIKKDYRRCVCGVDSIFYRIIDNTVEIMAILGRQDTNQIL